MTDTLPTTDTTGPAARTVRRRGLPRPLAALAVGATAVALSVALVAALTGGTGGTGGPTTAGGVDTAAGESRAVSPKHVVRIAAVDAYGGPEGTSRVVVHFAQPVPTDAPVYVDDIADPGVDGIAYTTQRPSGLRVCQHTHWFPGDRGTVDILIPERWLAPGTTMEDVTLRPIAVDGVGPAKLPMCGPYRGYVQLAVWGPASDDPDDVRAHVTPDGTRLVVELTPA